MKSPKIHSMRYSWISRNILLIIFCGKGDFTGQGQQSYHAEQFNAHQTTGLILCNTKVF